MTAFEISQAIQSANAPEVIALRDTDDEVPAGFAAYKVVRAVITDQSSAQNDVTLQDYDDDDAVVDTTVPISVGADETEVVGAETDDSVLTVPRGNQIRVNAEGDADVVLYVEPDSL